MARLALAFVLLSARVLADDGRAADGACRAEEAETSALLQSPAARKTEVAAAGTARWTPPPATSAPLPAGWHSAVDPATGKTYYYNDAGETSWDRPTPSPSPSPSPTSCQQRYGPCGSDGSTGFFQGDCCSGLECTTPAGAVYGTPKTCMPVGHEVGEPCGIDASSRQDFGECRSGLACAPPKNAMFGTPNVCANICGEFGTTGGAPMTIPDACNRMQSCSCKAETPCSAWKYGVEGCYMYCC